MSGSRAWVQVIVPDAENREKDDFYPTPPRATEALLSVEKFDGPIWEPACGDGAISRVLTQAGCWVHSTDLVYRNFGFGGIDFLLDHQTIYDNIVTNPPFKLAEEFAAHALKRSRKKVVMLARLAWLEGKARRRFFENSPLARVWVFSSRLVIARAGETWRSKQGGMIAFAWYVWEHGYTGKPTIGWL